MLPGLAAAPAARKPDEAPEKYPLPHVPLDAAELCHPGGGDPEAVCPLRKALKGAGRKEWEHSKYDRERG